MLEEKIVELVSLIPNDSNINHTMMVNEPSKRRNEFRDSIGSYSAEYCEKIKISFLPCFVDIDTYVREENGKTIMRVQGYVKMFLSNFEAYSDEQMDFLILLAKEYTTWSRDDDDVIRMEIWNFRKEI